jgi:hypothetical protein
MAYQYATQLQSVTGQSRYRLLWVGTIGLLVLDVVTTVVGLSLGAVEGNPVIAALLTVAPGPLALVVLTSVKLLAVAVALLLQGFVDTEYRWIVPVALGGPWLFAVVNNALIINAYL